MLRLLRPILRSLSFPRALWKHDIKQIDFKGSCEVTVAPYYFTPRKEKLLRDSVFLKKTAITCVSTYRNTSETSSADCSPILKYQCYEQQRFLLAGARRLLHKAFETTISGHVCTARIENRWWSPDRSWTCLFGMNTQCKATGGVQKAHPPHCKRKDC